MNYGQLRDIFNDEDIRNLITISNLPKEANGIMFVLVIVDVNSNYKDEIELLFDVKERYEKLLEFLTEDSTVCLFCPCRRRDDAIDTIGPLGMNLEKHME